MAAMVKVVSKEHWKILSEYLERSVILIPEEIAKKANIEYLNNKDVEYDFGGDPECYVDLATSENHFAIRHLKEKES